MPRLMTHAGCRISLDLYLIRAHISVDGWYISHKYINDSVIMIWRQTFSFILVFSVFPCQLHSTEAANRPFCSELHDFQWHTGCHSSLNLYLIRALISLNRWNVSDKYIIDTIILIWRQSLCFIAVFSFFPYQHFIISGRSTAILCRITHRVSLQPRLKPYQSSHFRRSVICFT